MNEPNSQIIMENVCQFDTGPIYSRCFDSLTGWKKNTQKICDIMNRTANQYLCVALMSYSHIEWIEVKLQ